MSAYANPDFVESAHDRVVEEREQRREEFESSLDDRQAVESAELPSYPDVDVVPMDHNTRIGVVNIDNPEEGETDPITVGKPSGAASIRILEKLDEMEKDRASMRELGAYVWRTLEEWSMDDEHDFDYWSNRCGLVDAITATRSLGLGGSDPNA